MIEAKTAIRSPWTAFAASLAVTTAAVPHRLAGYYCDEYGFLAQGVRLLSLWGKADFSAVSWSVAGYGTQNPKIGMYVCGALWTLADATPWTFPVFRFLNAALLAAACALVFDAVRRALGYAAAWTTLFLLIASPSLMSLRGYGFLEAPALFFAALALRAWFSIAPGAQASRSQALLWGAFAGLAAATRLHAAYFIAAIVAGTLVSGRKNLREGLKNAGVMLGVACAVFVVSNPLLWTRPLFGLRSMTVGHIASTGGSIDRVNAGSWERAANLLTTPWTADEPDPCSLPGQVDRFRPNRVQWFSIGLAAAGLVACAFRRRWRPVLLAACAAVLMAFVSATSPYHNKTGIYAALPWTILQGAIWLWLPPMRTMGARLRARGQRTKRIPGEA